MDDKEIKQELADLSRKVADALYDARLEPCAALGTVLRSIGDAMIREDEAMAAYERRKQRDKGEG